jgi:hypothetical protein
VESSRLGVSSDDVSFRIAEDSNNYDPGLGSVFAVSLRTQLLTIRIQSQRTYWPWSGTMEVLVSVNAEAPVTSFVGEVNCQLKVTLHPAIADQDRGATSLPKEAEEAKTATVTLRLHISAPPPREQRVLWDVFHSISYPSAFIPNDNPSDQRYGVNYYYYYSNERLA